MTAELLLRWEANLEEAIGRLKNGSSWTKFDYSDDSILKNSINEGLIFWKFVRHNLPARHFTTWSERQEVLSVFSNDKNIYIRLIAIIESLPTSMWRKILWRYNIDFMSKESFLRRIDNSQAQEIIANFSDLYILGVIPRVYGFWNKYISRVSVSKLMAEHYDEISENEKMMTKGALSYNLLGMDFGFNAYKNGTENDTCDFHVSVGRFMSLKNHVSDFVVNQEDGIYWWLYRTARSNCMYNAEAKIELSDHICPGFWLTLFVHLMFWIVSPVLFATMMLFAKGSGVSFITFIPWLIGAMITPVWIFFALINLAARGNIVIKVLTSFIWVWPWALYKLYKADLRWLDLIFATMIGLSYIFSIVFVISRMPGKPLSSHGEWVTYTAYAVTNLAALAWVYSIRKKKNEWRYGRTRVIMCASVMPYLTLVATALLVGIVDKLVEIGIIFFRDAMMNKEQYGLFLGVVIIYSLIFYVLYKVIKVESDKIYKSEKTTTQKEGEIDLLMLRLNVLIMFCLVAFVVFLASEISKDIVIFSFTSVMYFWLPAIGLIGIIFGVSKIKNNVQEERPRIKYLRMIIKKTDIHREWCQYVHQLDKNVSFMALKDKEKRELLVEADKLLYHLNLVHGDKVLHKAINLLATCMSFESILVVKSNWFELGHMSAKKKIVVIGLILNGMSYGDAIEKCNERFKDGKLKTFFKSFGRICLKPFEQLRVLYRLYEIFNKYCPYVDRQKVIE